MLRKGIIQLIMSIIYYTLHCDDCNDWVEPGGLPHAVIPRIWTGRLNVLSLGFRAVPWIAPTYYGAAQ